MADAQVKLYLDHVKVQVADATQKALEALAFQIEAQTKVNITENGQVDTGFMRNSTFVLTPDGVQGSPDPSGAYMSDRTGKPEERNLAPTASLGDAAAAVCVGAEYAIYQEIQQSFLEKAAEQVVPKAGGIVEPVYKELVHD